MKAIFYISVLMIVLSGCNYYIQVFETNTTNTEKDGEFYVYETDTLKITYAFWSKKGVLSFAVYNKHEKPLFIDWKKSSYIDNSNKLNYWIDEEIFESVSYYGSYFYGGPLLIPGFGISDGTTKTTGSKVKVERITFIPPKSNYYRSQFYLLPLPYYKFDEDTGFEEVNRNGSPKKKTKVYTKEFTEQNSPLVFRNFLSFSFEEDFENEFYIDNEFYLSSMKEMDYRHFHYIKKDEDGIEQNIKPYKEQTSFYLYVEKAGTVQYRKRNGRN